jgi:dipeptidyl aminopeptidase/acylaminoacyl peptidase
VCPGESGGAGLLVAVLAVAVVPAAASGAVPKVLAYQSGGSEWKAGPVYARGFGDRPGRTLISRRGLDPIVSTSGRAIAYLTPSGSGTLTLATWSGSRVHHRALLKGVDVTGVFAPDDAHIAASVRSSSGRRRLVLVDTATGAKRTIVPPAQGFDGVSFSPDGQRIAYVLDESTIYDGESRGDLFTVGVDGGARRRLTSDRRALSPLWGPAGIAYARLRKHVFKKEHATLDLIQPDGTRRRTLAVDPHTSPDADGLVPVAWSRDGTRLVADAYSDRSTEGWTIDLRTGVAHDLTGKRDGVIAWDVSADGTAVLAQVHASLNLNDPGRSTIETIPFGGGTPEVLVPDATLPSWSHEPPS